jgi:archaemetzincin
MQHITILPFDGIEKKYIDTAADIIQNILNMEVSVLISQPIRNFSESNKHKRYNAISILYTLRNYYTLDNTIVGLTNKDLFSTEWSWVYGYGHLYHKSAIVSTAHIENNMQRFSKVFLHEIMHTFGLDHCISDCIMRPTNSTNKPLDRLPFYLCRFCHYKMQIGMRR